MKLLVVLTFFKNIEFLKNCINSIKKQTFKDFKVIIVDDGPELDVKVAIRSLIDNDPRFIYHKNLFNIGAAHSFEEQILKYGSEYIMMLHHDDYINEDFMSKLISGLDFNPACSFGYSLCYRNNNGIEGNDFPTSIRPELTTGVYDLSLHTAINCWTVFSSIIIRRTCYEKIGGFNFYYSRFIKRKISHYRSGESDLYTIARLASIGLVYVVNERLCAYRNHDESNSNNLNLKATHIQDNLRTYDYIFDEFENFSDEVRLVSKINSIARLALGHDVFAEVTERLLYKSPLGLEFIDIRDRFVFNFAEVLSTFILDSSEKNFPKIVSVAEIEAIKKLSFR